MKSMLLAALLLSSLPALANKVAEPMYRCSVSGGPGNKHVGWSDWVSHNIYFTPTNASSPDDFLWQSGYINANGDGSLWVEFQAPSKRLVKGKTTVLKVGNRKFEIRLGVSRGHISLYRSEKFKDGVSQDVGIGFFQDKPMQQYGCSYHPSQPRFL